MWADPFARAQPGDAEPLVRIVHQGRGDGPQLDPTVPQEVCDNIAVQTDGSAEGRGILNIWLLSSKERKNIILFIEIVENVVTISIDIVSKCKLMHQNIFNFKLEK